MGKANHRSRGFTLIAALLLLLLLSGVAVGLMYLVTGQGHVGSNDLEANEAYYGAESGMACKAAAIASGLGFGRRISFFSINLWKKSSTSELRSSSPSGSRGDASFGFLKGF